jgi:hypothetical protein
LWYISLSLPSCHLEKRSRAFSVKLSAMTPHVAFYFQFPTTSMYSTTEAAVSGAVQKVGVRVSATGW